MQDYWRLTEVNAIGYNWFGTVQDNSRVSGHPERDHCQHVQV